MKRIVVARTVLTSPTPRSTIAQNKIPFAEAPAARSRSRSCTNIGNWQAITLTARIAGTVPSFIPVQSTKQIIPTTESATTVVRIAGRGSWALEGTVRPA